MQNSKPSVFESRSAFDLLARPIQRWIRQQGWPSLREVQERAIPMVLGGGDILIAASTASGKTEAAFLPLMTRALASSHHDGFKILYISPLKALINDQHRRLDSLCALAQMSLHKWHGDVSQSAKTRARRDCDGILLITPESLEATLMRRGSEAVRLFGALEGIIIDELHAFIGTERGLQLTSLMSRIEQAAQRRIDRIGLSATLGELKLCATALRPDDAGAVNAVDMGHASKAPNIEIETWVAGSNPEATAEERDKERAAVDRGIAERLFHEFARTPNLVFGNSRAAVETYAALLRDLCLRHGMANAFLPHHGKLSRELREFAEAEIRERQHATTIVATSTLEMGVDIGSVERVAQIGPANAVAALRQRVGRSGRRVGQRPSLWMFIREKEASAQAPLSSRLHTQLVQGLAEASLLREGWCEPPVTSGLHLSTLAHQIMALIAQHNGRQAQDLFHDLCLRGPFRNVTPSMFVEVLRWMGSTDRALIEQRNDGVLLLGRKGERWTDHFTFFAVFPTPEEFRVLAEGVTLGTLEPTPAELTVGNALIFAGRRWDITEVSIEAKVIRVTPSGRGAPVRGSGGIAIHEAIAQRMHDILFGTRDAFSIDIEGERLLANARDAFRMARLSAVPIQQRGRGFDLYPWSGTREIGALAIVLCSMGFSARVGWPCIEVYNATSSALIAALKEIASAPAPQIDELIAHIEPPPLIEKFDFAVPPVLRTRAYLTERVNLGAVPRLAQFLIRNTEEPALLERKAPTLVPAQPRQIGNDSPDCPALP